MDSIAAPVPNPLVSKVSSLFQSFWGKPAANAAQTGQETTPAPQDSVELSGDDEDEKPPIQAETKGAEIGAAAGLKGGETGGVADVVGATKGSQLGGLAGVTGAAGVDLAGVTGAMQGAEMGGLAGFGGMPGGQIDGTTGHDGMVDHATQPDSGYKDHYDDPSQLPAGSL